MELERGYTALWARKAEIPDRIASGKIGGGERVETEARKRWGHARGARGGRTRKVETTCKNNVRVFDLRHVTEPH